MIEVGQYLNDGTNELLVGHIKEYKDKLYAYLIDEQKEIGFFVECIRENDGYRFNRVKSKTLTELLIIEFSDIENVIKNQKIDID